MDSTFNVVFTGLNEGVAAEEFEEKFCSKFGISHEKAQQLSSSNSDVIIKKGLSESKAGQYQTAFENCGMTVRIDKIAAEPEVEQKPAGGLSMVPMEKKDEEEFGAANNSPESQLGGHSVCPKCGSSQIEDDECMACGIYISKYQEAQKNDQAIVQDEAQQTSAVNNPYATPTASLERHSVSQDGQGTLEGGINGDYDFTIKEVFSEAWERTNGAKWTLILAWILYLIVAVAVNAVFAFLGPDHEVLIAQERFSEAIIWSVLPSLVSIPILYPLLAGITLLGIHRSVDADITATSIFGHYNKAFTLLIFTLLMSVMIMIGFLLLVIPGIYLSVAYLMAMALIIDKNLTPWAAMEASRKAISKHWFKIFFIYLLLGLLMIVSAIPFLIGLIWLLPLSAILHGVMYKYMFGVDSVA